MKNIDKSSHNEYTTSITGIIDSNGSFVFPGLSNSFILYENFIWWKKHRYLFIFLIISIIQLLFVFTDFKLISFSKGGLYDFATIGIDMGGFASRRRASEYIEIDEVFGNQYVEKKKKIIDNTKEDFKGTGEDTYEGDGGFGGVGGLVDLSFRPEVKPPRIINKLKKIYPKQAKELGLEANCFVELIIDSEGKVKRIKVLHVRLSKTLTAVSTEKIKQDFSSAAYQILSNAYFTPAVIGGKRVSVRLELPLAFKLD